MHVRRNFAVPQTVSISEKHVSRGDGSLGTAVLGDERPRMGGSSSLISGFVLQQVRLGDPRAQRPAEGGLEGLGAEGPKPAAAAGLLARPGSHLHLVHAVDPFHRGQVAWQRPHLLWNGPRLLQLVPRQPPAL